MTAAKPFLEDKIQAQKILDQVTKERTEEALF